MTRTAADKTTAAVGTVLGYAAQGGKQVHKAVSDALGDAFSTTKADKLDSDERDDGNSSRPVMADTRQAMYDAGSGVAEAVSHVASSAKQTTTDVLSHNYGSEASQLASTTGESAANVGKTTVAAVHGLSLTGLGAGAAVGAAQGPDDDDEAR